MYAGSADNSYSSQRRSVFIQPHKSAPEQLILLPDLCRWLVIAAVVGVLAGTASAVLLASLEWATQTREAHPWLIALLPVAGLGIGLVYKFLGKSVEAGNNLLLEEIHDPKTVIPARMTPLILLGTAVSHLFGGSAGREGTALQTGASLADQLTRLLRLNPPDRRILLMSGISAGFASVFGTPLAGAIFGLEVLAIGKLRYDALFPCFIAAVVGDRVTLLWGLHHTPYSVGAVSAIGLSGLLSVIVAGIAFGLTGMLFAKTTHAISRSFKQAISYGPLRPFLGGAVVALAVFALGSTKYIGLGIPTIVEAFGKPLPPWDFAGKFAFTTVTLGSGFKGGEVTPLFYIGATLGNALAYVLPLPLPLLAGMGFVAVFAGAANTPIASMLMAIELFGAEAGMYAGLACVVSYLFSGHAGIYQTQRVGLSKHRAWIHEEGLSLALLTTARISADIDLYRDIDHFGFRKGNNSVLSNNLTVLRLYFHSSAKIHTQSWWSRTFGTPLGPHLLSKAKEAGVGQAVLHRVHGGFLQGDSLTFDMSEVPPPKLPQCLELIADGELLSAFLEMNSVHLTNVRVVALRGEQLEFGSQAAAVSV